MTQVAHRQISLLWDADWRTTVFTCLILPLFLSLGWWQLDRAAQKEHIARTWQLRQQQAPLPFSALGEDPQELAYRRVSLVGEFLPGRDFLLDNRMQQGRYGFEVITPLRLVGSAGLVLVNRGWVAGDPARRELPQFMQSSGVQQLHGIVYVPPGEPYTLGEQADSGAWPRQLLALDVELMAKMLGEPVHPYSVRLDADSPTALDIDWPLVNSSADKHRAYAVQWFTMAGALLCLYLVRSSNVLQWLRSSRVNGED